MFPSAGVRSPSPSAAALYCWGCHSYANELSKPSAKTGLPGRKLQIMKPVDKFCWQRTLGYYEDLLRAFCLCSGDGSQRISVAQMRDVQAEARRRRRPCSGGDPQLPDQGVDRRRLKALRALLQKRGVLAPVAGLLQGKGNERGLGVGLFVCVCVLCSNYPPEPVGAKEEERAAGCQIKHLASGERSPPTVVCGGCSQFALNAGRPTSWRSRCDINGCLRALNADSP